MEQEYAISCHKIAISWKPICKNWKSFVINDALCLGLFGGGNLELPWGKFGVSLWEIYHQIITRIYFWDSCSRSYCTWL